MNIAITGGTGTLGRVLIKTFLERGHERIVSISRDEVKAGDLRSAYMDNRLNVFLGDVRDRERLTLAFRGCDAVVHAAALKRVPVGEAYDSLEMIKTNIQGTVNVVLAAMASGVKRVVVVSSDKAVHPENLYGATKLVAEKFAVQANEYTHPAGTMVSVVRYGNVWNSRGSVVEVWRKGCEGPYIDEVVPLTDERMTRFVITQAQAANLVCEALERMQGGEVFVPDLPAMRLTDLAEAMGVGYGVVGLRPGGEKIHEQMISEEEYHRVLQIPEPPFTLLIKPSHRSWSHEPYKGNKVHTPYPYKSDNVRFLTVAELRDLCTHT
jgi:UDP-N-acetylglucosamine 4,6-dehydratase